MTSFHQPLDLRDNGDGTFSVLNGFSYIPKETIGTGLKVMVPAGFQTDFASVPRIFWNIFPPYGRHGKAAVIHDYLYALVRQGKFHRAMADAVFLAAMKELGVSWWRRTVMYLSVRLFGWSAVRS